MSDDEERYEEEDAEVEADDEPNQYSTDEENYGRRSYGEDEREERDRLKKQPRREVEQEPEQKELTEAEKALLAQRKKHEADDAEKLKDYEEMRRIQRERDEEELRQLKEKQERRRQEREEEDKLLNERRRAEEERHRNEEEQRKAKLENEKRKKEQEKKKKQAMMAGMQSQGPNFELPKKDPNSTKMEKVGNIMMAKSQMGMTKEQHEELKRRSIIELMKSCDVEGLDLPSLKAKVKELHQRICKLESQKYDLEQRKVRQEYDLKELNERQRQIARNKALKKGLDPETAANSKHPPKVPTASKYDRQIDRRSYGDRKYLFDSDKTPKAPGIFHGSARPPTEWGRRVVTEEMENIRKNLGPVKYVEMVRAEGARPPMEPIPVQMPPEEVED